ncbi:LA_2272/LA_2273 family lipoprotein [Leptospira stimsonii]|nr:hypothetical protein [Leptospira stimsonii]
MKINIKYGMASIISFGWILLCNCGVALTPRLTAKIPKDTSTELVRINLISGEAGNIYGLNLGLANIVQHDLIGAQIGIINGATSASGIQVGLVNNATPAYGLLKIGVLNLNFFLDSGRSPVEKTLKSSDRRIKGDTGLSIGIANVASGRMNIGLFNYGYGWNIGAINWNGEGSAVSLGVINLGEKENFQIGILNFCKEGPLPFMIVLNYCKPARPGVR